MIQTYVYVSNLHSSVMDNISVLDDELLICLRAPAEPAQGFWEKQLLIQTSRII